MPNDQHLLTEDQYNKLMDAAELEAVDTEAVVPGKAAPSVPSMVGGSTPAFFSGSLPPQFQLDSNFARARVTSTRVPHNDLMPLGFQSNPSTNAAANSTSRVLARTPGFTNMDLVTNGQTRVALASASATPGSSGGHVAFNFRGVWLAVVPYFKGDEVIYQTSYWQAQAASTNSAPATGNANWQVVGSYAAFRGPWSSSTAYVAGDEVTYNGNFWVATVANTNSAPSTSNSNWVIAGPNNLDAVQDGNTFGRTPTSNYGQQTPIGKVTGLEVSSNADLEFGLTGYSIYDNNASGSITITQVTDNNSPNGNNTKMKIVEAKVGAGPTPGLGGFFYTLSQDNGVITGDTYHVGDTYIVDLVANIPVGYTLNFANNSLGTGGSFQWLNASLAGSSTAPTGTGNWQHYLVKVIIGTSPSSSNAFPFFYLTGADGVTWYVSSMEILDMDQIPRKSGGGRHIGPGPGGGVKWGHGIGVNGGARSVGVVMHGGNNRTFMTTDPFYGVYGNPSLPHQIFLNGGYVGHDVSSVNNPRLRVNSTGAGREYSFMSNQDGTARINDETGGATRTYLNSSPHWGFYGSPTQPIHCFYGNDFGFSCQGAAPGVAYIDTNASGLDYGMMSGGPAAGIGTINQNGVAYRTYLNNTPQWGFYGTPGSAPRATDVQVFGPTGGENSVTATGAQPGFCCNDTGASGLNWGFNSGVNVAGAYEITQPNIARRVQMNNTPQWGFFGSPSVELETQGVNYRQTRSGQNNIRNNDTQASGREYGISSGSTAGVANIIDATANANRTFLTSDPRWGYFGTPTSGLACEIFTNSANAYCLTGNTSSGANCGWRAFQSGSVGGRDFGWLSGFPTASEHSTYDFTAAVQRIVLDSSGNSDFGGSSSPTNLSAGGVAFSDLSGNLKLKNINNAAGTTVGPTTSSTTYAVIPQMTITITTKGNDVLISFAATLFCTAGSGLMSAFWAVFKDGSQISGDYEVDVLSTEGALGFAAAALWIDAPSAASHTYDIRWKAGGATGTTVKAIGTARSLQVVELG